MIVLKLFFLITFLLCGCTCLKFEEIWNPASNYDPFLPTTTPPTPRRFDKNSLFVPGMEALTKAIQNLLLAETKLLLSKNTISRKGYLDRQMEIADQLLVWFGVSWKSKEGRQCFENYLALGEILNTEILALRRFCANERLITESSRNLDQKKIDKLLTVLKRLLRICTVESNELLMGVTEYETLKWEKTLKCILEPNLIMMGELATTNYFQLIQNKTQLYIDELSYLLPNRFPDYITRSFVELAGIKLESDLMQNNTNNETLYLPETVRKVLKQSMKKEIGEIQERLQKRMKTDKPSTLRLELDQFKKAMVNLTGEMESKFLQLLSIANKSENIFNQFLRMSKNNDNQTIKAVLPQEIRGLIKDFNRLIEIMDLLDAGMWNPNVNGGIEEFPLSSMLSSSALFTGRSSTFGKQCENSKSHLTGTCSPENNEVCVVESTSSVPIPNSTHFTKNLNLVFMEYILPKKCVCGFHKNCAIDFNNQTTMGTDTNEGTWKLSSFSSCFLTPNEKAQCRGEIGYPCKAYPLEKNKFSETCISGQCDKTENECV